jgi:hypothetical protein
MPPRLEPQLAMDEQAITNATLEAALERRLRIKDDIAEARGVLRTANDEVNAEIAKIPDFAPDTALRVGRFRITKTHIPGRSVAFDVEARDQIRIGLVDEDGEVTKPTPIRKGVGSFGKPAAAKADDEADLRPKGEVNIDALRGEADRASLS